MSCGVVLAVDGEKVELCGKPGAALVLANGPGPLTLCEAHARQVFGEIALCLAARQIKTEAA